MGNNNGDSSDDIISRNGTKPVNYTQREIFNIANTCKFI